MGIDRFSNFITKSITNGIDDINIENNIRKIISNHVIFDANFIIYQEIIEVENDINDIIKILLCLPFISGNTKLLEEQINKILEQPHWESYKFGENLNSILDGFNEDEIIKNFIYFITKQNEDNISISEMVIFEKIYNEIIYLIDNIHYSKFIQNISIFFDGIPSISKVMEQRRRRLKNYIESQERNNVFKKYFDNLNINNKKISDSINKKYLVDDSDKLIFDYFKWLDNRITLDKSIAPSSKFIKKLESFLENKLKSNYDKVNIYINSSNENGESDIKIFKYISENDQNGDYCIHTTDSDLIYQILVQQTYYKIINKDINLTLSKYIKNASLVGYTQILDASIIIKQMLELYNNINNIKTNNYKIIWDLCIIFNLFGNDHLPISIEIGAELGLEYYLKKHYEALDKNNIINIKKTYISLDLNSLKMILESINIDKKKNMTRIILQRFFKINMNLINIFVDVFKYDFNDILTFLKKFIIYKSIETIFDKDNLKYKYSQNIENIEVYKDLSIFNFSEVDKNIFLNSINLIDENIDYYDESYNGLILYSKFKSISNDQYQDLYNFVVDNNNNKLINKYPKLYDHVNIEQHLNQIKNNKIYNCNDYLKKIYHLTIIQFGNMKEYNDNLTFYKYYQVPLLEDIIKFIDNSDTNITKQWFKEIKDDNLEKNKYLNSTNHYILISPFIRSDNKINIENLWLENIDNFDYRNIDIHKFFEEWNNSIVL